MERLFVGVAAFVALGAVVIVGVIVAAVVFGIRQWRRNNAAPVLSIPVVVVGKRTETSGGAGDTAASTWYYVTFEQGRADRFELHVRPKDYAMIAERDRGTLTYQGTRFKGFDRVLPRRDISDPVP